MKWVVSLISFCVLSVGWVGAQELDCKVTVNHSQIQGTNQQVFKTLEASLNEFVNRRSWTNAQYESNERIRCSMILTVKTYNEQEARWTCDLTIQSTRPVWQSNYHSPLFLHKDTEVIFTYREFDVLELRDNEVTNNVSAIMAYYAYLLIGLDMDTMALEGGTDVLRRAEMILVGASNLGEIGWKAFDNGRNRYALLSDYLSESMRPLRKLMYEYHRMGFDAMIQNAVRARAQITSSLSLLEAAHKQGTMVSWPAIFTEIKKEELINLYAQASIKEKELVSALLLSINPYLADDWGRLKNKQ